MVISGAPVSVLIDHGLPESIVEALVGAGIGTVERLGSMTPEQLEAIPGIDEEIVGQIQSAVMSFYSSYDTEENEAENREAENEAVPTSPEEIEKVIDASSEAGQERGERGANLSAFENIKTGVLERDLATHELPEIDQVDEGEVVDLGRVEGLSAAPSSLRDVVSENAEESSESDTMGKIE